MRNNTFSFTDFENFELAAFLKYRGKGLMMESKKKLMLEIDKRRLYKNDMDSYLLTAHDIDRKDLKENKICPRCYSSKFFDAVDTETVTFSYSTTEYKVSSKTCLICLYSKDRADHKKEQRNLFSFLSFLSKKK